MVRYKMSRLLQRKTKGKLLQKDTNHLVVAVSRGAFFTQTAGV